ncbi:MAG: hypothetical protein AAF414_16500 [Pseudomonadota bacterium]
MSLKKLSVISAVVGFAALSFTQPGIAQDRDTADGGTFGCISGTHRDRSDTNESQSSRYHIANFDEEGAIQIDQIRVYDAEGTLRCDYPGTDAFPDHAEFRQQIAPHQTSIFRSSDWADCSNGITDLARNERPVQVLIDWSTVDDEVVIPVVASILRSRDSETNEHILRSDNLCVILNARD